MPSHYLKKYRNNCNKPLGNKLPWSFKRNSYISIQENVFQNVVRKLAAILSRSQYVKPSGTFPCLVIRLSLIRVLACCLLGFKPLSEPMLLYWKLEYWLQIPAIFEKKQSPFRKMYGFEGVVCQKGGDFVSTYIFNIVSFLAQAITSVYSCVRV